MTLRYKYAILERSIVFIILVTTPSEMGLSMKMDGRWVVDARATNNEFSWTIV
jgi:hypothetical protein